MNTFDITYHSSQITNYGNDVFHNADVFGSIELLGQSFDILFQCGQTYYNNDYSAPSTALGVSDNSTDDFVLAMWQLTESEIEAFTQDDIAEYKEMFDKIENINDLLEIHRSINESLIDAKNQFKEFKEDNGLSDDPEMYIEDESNGLAELKRKSVKTTLQQGTGEKDIQWYSIRGSELGCEFNGEEWGFEIETGRVIDPDGCPVTEGDYLDIAAKRMFSLAK